MDFYSISKKFVRTFTFNKKQKLLNTLTYNGDDILEEPPVYQEVFDWILDEEKINQYNSDQGSMINLLIKMSRELEGGSNYIMKSLSLLIKWYEFFRDSQAASSDIIENTPNLTLFTQSFLDFHPAISITKDMNDYKPELKEKIAIITGRILTSQIKLAWVESQGNDTKTEALLNKYSTSWNHSKSIFTQGFSSFELIKTIVEWNDLLDNEAFMTWYIFQLKQTIMAYKASLDYSNMVCEVAKTQPVGNEVLHKCITCWEEIEALSSEFHLMLEMYAYFLKDNEINETQIPADESQYGRKRATEIKRKLFNFNYSFYRGTEWLFENNKIKTK